MKYFVIAERFDYDKKAQAKHIVGEFDSYPCAKIFKDAYNEYLVITLENGETSTFCNSHVDLFRI